MNASIKQVKYEMKNLLIDLSINTSLISLGFLVHLSPAFAAYIYNVNRIVPCSEGCNGEISVTGTITTDSLGQLTEDNFIDWTLIFNSPDYTNIIRTPENSELAPTRDPLLNATATELTYIAPSPGDFEETQQFLFRTLDDAMDAPPFVSWGFIGGRDDFEQTAESLNLSITTGQPEPGNLGVRPLPEGNGGTVILGTKAVPEPFFGLGTITALGVGILLKKQRRKSES